MDQIRSHAYDEPWVGTSVRPRRNVSVNPSAATPLHTEWLAAPAPGDDRRPIVLLHGFSQNTRCWGSFADELAASGPVFAVDAPGHGGSSTVRADLPASAALLGQTLDAVIGDPAVVVGYSMGGRLGLHLALARPDLVGALVVIGATGGIDDPVERTARRAADAALADHLLAIGLDAFIGEWLTQPLFTGLTTDAACCAERLTNDADGLASSLRRAGTGTQDPLWDQLGTLTMPVLVLAGSEDAKFRALGNRLVRSVGTNATAGVIDGASHAVHLACPVATAQAIRAWLADTDTDT